MRKEIINYSTSNSLKIRKRENKKIFKNNTNFQKEILKILDATKNKIILDVGCGNGDFLEYLYHHKPDCKLYGLDISKGMIKEAKKDTNKKIKYYVASVQKIPFKSETFDIIIAKHMLYHAEDINKAIAEIYRVLKKDGILIITLNSLDNNSRANIEKYKQIAKKILHAKLVETVTRINTENYKKYINKNQFRILEVKKYFSYGELKDSQSLVSYVSSYREFFVPKPSIQKWNETLNKLKHQIDLELKKNGSITEVRGTGIIKLQKIKNNITKKLIKK